MITVMDLINKIDSLIKAKYPKNKIYITSEAENIIRPAFFIEFVGDDSMDANRTITDNTKSFQIVYLPEKKKYQFADIASQFNVTETIKNIFKQGYIYVGSKLIKVVSISSGRIGTEAYINVSFEYFDDRPMDPNAETYELMNEFEFNEGGN